jgi:TolB-like protein
MKYVASVVALVTCSLLIASESAVADPAPPPASGHQRVLIFPFTRISTPGKLDWLSHGIQEDIMTELNSSRGMQAMTPPAGQDTAPADIAAAVDQGRAAGANYVVFGKYQASDTELRISGSVVDVRDPQRDVTKLKVTGPVTAVFRLEDALDEQVESAVGLGPPPATTAAANNPPPSYQPPSAQPPSYQPPPQAPSENYIGPYDSPGYVDQTPYYGDYPAYGYGYTPYYYGGYPYSLGFVYGGRGFYGGGFRGGFRGGFAGGGFHGGGGFRGGGGGFHGGGGGGHR